MNIRFLETFLWLARLKNFRLTAEKLHITQAAISGRIAGLEEEFGVRLFDRGAREVSLTQDGTKVLPYAERIVRLSQDLKREVGDKSRFGGLIRLGVIESVVHSWLPALLERLRGEFPELIVELTSDTTRHLSEQLQRGNIDASIQTGPVSGAGLSSLRLGSYPMRWVARRQLNLGETSLDMDDLATHPIISFSKGSDPHVAITELFADAGIDHARINCVNSVAAIIRLVLDGYGIAALPPAVMLQQIEQGELVVLRVAKPFPPLELVVSFRSGDDSPLLPHVARHATDTMAAFALAYGDSAATSLSGEADSRKSMVQS